MLPRRWLAAKGARYNELLPALCSLQRLTADGAVKGGLAEELAWVESLFAGAAATASTELGLGPPDGANADVRCFAAWRAKLQSDPDISSDLRMLVPVFRDERRKQTKVWAVLGGEPWRWTRSTDCRRASWWSSR